MVDACQIVARDRRTSAMPNFRAARCATNSLIRTRGRRHSDSFIVARVIRRQELARYRPRAFAGGGWTGEGTQKGGRNPALVISPGGTIGETTGLYGAASRSPLPAACESEARAPCCWHPSGHTPWFTYFDDMHITLTCAENGPESREGTDEAFQVYGNSDGSRRQPGDGECRGGSGGKWFEHANYHIGETRCWAVERRYERPHQGQESPSRRKRRCVLRLDGGQR